MSIRVRYFASLREAVGRAEDDIDAAEIRCAADVWRHANPGLPMPERVLIAINMEYGAPDQPVADGDEVAFFPPVTGGGSCRSS